MRRQKGQVMFFLSAVDHSRWNFAMPVLIYIPKGGSSRGLNEGQKGAEGHYLTDVRSKAWFTCRRWEVILCHHRGSSKCLARGAPRVKPLSSFQLELHKFKSGARRKASTFCSWQCFSRSVRMRVEVDRERKASSGLWGKKTDINSNQGHRESWCFKACLFALPSQISFQSEYMPAGMGKVLYLHCLWFRVRPSDKPFYLPWATEPFQPTGLKSKSKGWSWETRWKWKV